MWEEKLLKYAQDEQLLEYLYFSGNLSAKREMNIRKLHTKMRLIAPLIQLSF